MFGNKPTQKLPHHPRNPRKPDDELPRGECHFIITNGQRERCPCVSFYLSQTIPGACGCGHQAWNHVREPSGSYVPLDDHLALQDKVKILEETNRKLQEDILREKKEKDQTIQHFVKVNTTNLMQLKYYFDDRSEQLRTNMEHRVEDRIEQIEDRAEGAYAEVEDLRTKFQDMEEILMRLIEDVDAGRRPSRSLTPLLEGQASPLQPPMPERVAPDLPIRTASSHTESWDVRIVLVPSRNAPFAFGFDTVAFRRCQTRGLHQDIHLKDKLSQTFASAVETSFTAILRRRFWMPLQCINSSELSLQHLDATYLKPSSWDYGLLEAQCLAHNKQYGGDVIFIALKDEDLSWDDIKNLPRIFGSDESCWKHDEELDAPLNNKESMDMEYTIGNGRMTADTDSTYGDYSSPPPYVPRANPETPRQGPVNSQTALDVLADLSAQRPTLGGAPSIHTSHSAPSVSGSIGSSIGSIDSTLATNSDYADSELHRDKRPKRLMPLHVVPVLPGTPPHHQQQPTQVVQQGRVKRKVTANSKYREPMDWRPSEISLKFLHKRPTTSSGPQQQQGQGHLPLLHTPPPPPPPEPSSSP
jgi:hypothetical protein